MLTEDLLLISIQILLERGDACMFRNIHDFLATSAFVNMQLVGNGVRRKLWVDAPLVPTHSNVFEIPLYSLSLTPWLSFPAEYKRYRVFQVREVCLLNAPGKSHCPCIAIHWERTSHC